LENSLRIDQLDAGYGRTRVLHKVSLHVRSGEIVVLLGTNGNGKSSLINAIMGLVQPEAGAIDATLDGMTNSLVGRSTQAIAALGITLVPEGRRLFPRLSVHENLRLGASRAGARRHFDDSLAYCLETFPILKDRLKQLAGSMSGGEQQMVALARAMMAAPRILLIDEPSVGLAPIYVTRMIDKIEELRTTRHLTILMAEQNFRQASRIADRGYVIVHGKVVFEGKSRSDLLDNDDVKRLYLAG